MVAGGFQPISATEPLADLPGISTCIMHLEGQDIKHETASLVERHLPWKDFSETDSAAKSFRTSPTTPPVSKRSVHSSSHRPPSPPPAPLPPPQQQQPSNLEVAAALERDEQDDSIVDLANCGLSTLPWRNGCSELPSISLMCSEGTCPSLCEPEVSHHLEQVCIPSKLDIVDDDGYISRATNDQLDEVFLEVVPATTASNTDNAVTSTDGSPGEGSSLNHLWSRRHEYVSHHHHHHHKHVHEGGQQGSSRCASPRFHQHHQQQQSSSAMRFVLEGENWSAEEEASWQQLETRVWSWLDQVELETPRADCATGHVPVPQESQLPQLS